MKIYLKYKLRIVESNIETRQASFIKPLMADSRQSKEDTYRALGMAGIEPTPSKSKD